MKYETPLKKRLRDAERYWENPAVRLKKVNARRARKGQPLAVSVDEIGQRREA